MALIHLQLVTTALIFLLTPRSDTISHDLVISDVDIVDIYTGKINKNRTVGIDSDTITTIYKKKVRISDSTTVIDGSSMFLIPGLWDMHVHYNWNYSTSSPLLIANGVTGVREMWGFPEMIDELKSKMRNGEIVAPDIYTAGSIIDGDPPIWRGSTGVKSAEEVQEIVEKQIKEGADFLKVYSGLDEEVFLAIANAANAHNIPFAGHVPNTVSIYTAIDAGMASSEHMYGILEASSNKSDSILQLDDRIERTNALVSSFNETKFDSLATVLAASDMWLCPTLTVLRAFGFLTDTSFTNDPRVAYLPEYLTSSWNPKNDFRLKNATDDTYAKLKESFDLRISLIGMLNKKGVKFLAGTDFPNPYCFPGFSLHDELSLLVEGGLSELDALRSATLNPAVFMGKENEMGSVQVGRLASLVLLNSNPLENISNTKDIQAVVLRGEFIDRSALDQMLVDAKTDAANTSN